ncbi:MAG: hypothetical protein PUA62_05745 [Lachnospiraceae bacterium]|nr:hypothetical protein [Lachnospiraceae bacterium]
MNKNTSSNKVIVNREYKSTLFSMLFRDKEAFLELYNAINHTHYTDTEEIRIVTLENAVYMGVKNDLAFVIDLHLNLYEHQSTYNPNIPLRDLFYIAQEYKTMFYDKSLYSRKQIKIPMPRFLVFYNGVEDRPEREVLKLSDAYYTKDKTAGLELTVTALNINEGKNRELMEGCKTLREYTQYVARIRRFVRECGMPLDEAVEQAVDTCIREGILAEFLRKNRAEVMMLSLFEYNEEEEREKFRRAEREYGFEQGMEQGKRLMLQSMIQAKHAKGKTPSEIAQELETDIETVKELL